MTTFIVDVIVINELHGTLVVVDRFVSYAIYSLVDVNTYHHSQSLELVRQ